MELLAGVWTYVVPFLLVLTVLVFVHELGHFSVARACGVRVEVFSVGFGPEIVGWTDRTGTRWKISAIPFGGYVKMYGEHTGGGAEETPSAPSSADARVSFATKRVSQRAAIVAAGPAANFLFAIVILAGLFVAVGQPYTPPDVGEVQPGSAAAAAGFRPGDVIKSLNGAEIDRFEQVQNIVQGNAGRELTVVITREGVDQALRVVPQAVEITDRFGGKHLIGRLGISRTSADVKLVRYDPLTAVWRALAETASMTERILDAIWQIINGTRTTQELGGPLRIAQMSGDMAQAGVVSLILFAAVLSINLGLINLFPIPMLDGGHLVFFAAEAIRGKAISERTQEYGFRIGLFLVLCLMVFVTWNDLVQLKVVSYFKNLVS